MNFRLSSYFKKLPLIGKLYEVYQCCQSPVQYLLVWKDYQKTKKSFREVRLYSKKVTKKNSVLIVSMTNDIYILKLEIMLALEFMMSEHTIVVLTSRTNYWAMRYYRAVGIINFIYLEKVSLSRMNKQEVNQDVQNFLTDHLDVQTIKAWRYKGAKIGPQILSSLSRLFFEGAIDLNRSEVKTKLLELLPIVLATVHKAEKIIKRVNPKLIYLIEANYAINGVIVDKAIESGVNVIQVIQPSRDDALVMKRLTKKTRGIHPFSLDVETVQLAYSFEWKDDHEKQLEEEFNSRYNGKWFLQSRNMSRDEKMPKSELVSKFNLDKNKKTAVIFSHVLWDANLFYGEDLFQDYGEWFIETVKAACENTKVNWIVKLHPVNLWKRKKEGIQAQMTELKLIEDHIGQLPPHVGLAMPGDPVDNKVLFSLTDYGVTVRGTIGLELPCFGITTLTAGTGRYSGLGFTVDSKTRAEYLQKIKNIEKILPMDSAKIELAKKHAYALFLWRPWIMKSFKSTFKLTNHSGRLDHNLFPLFASLEEYKKNTDLKSWFHWAVHTDKEDYLSEVGE